MHVASAPSSLPCLGWRRPRCSCPGHRPGRGTATSLPTRGVRRVGVCAPSHLACSDRDLLTRHLRAAPTGRTDEPPVIRWGVEGRVDLDGGNAAAIQSRRFVGQAGRQLPSAGPADTWRAQDGPCSRDAPPGSCPRRRLGVTVPEGASVATESDEPGFRSHLGSCVSRANALSGACRPRRARGNLPFVVATLPHGATLDTVVTVRDQLCRWRDRIQGTAARRGVARRDGCWPGATGARRRRRLPPGRLGKRRWSPIADLARISMAWGTTVGRARGPVTPMTWTGSGRLMAVGPVERRIVPTTRTFEGRTRLSRSAFTSRPGRPFDGANGC